MRICVVSYSFYEFDNRVQRYAETLARHGHAVEVFARRAAGSPPFATVNRVNVRRIQESSLNETGRLHFFIHLFSFILRSAFLVAREHWRRPFDLVHAHSPPDFIVCAAVFPRILGVPIILDIHDLGPELYAARFKAGRPSVAFKALLAVEKICCRFASHVIIANDLWRTRLVSRSVKPDRCAAILNYPDPRLFHQFRPKRAGPRFVLMYPGTLSRHQGLDIAIKGIKIIARAREDIDLHIYGDGASEAELRNLVKELKLENRVLFFPPLPFDQIREKMIDADLGIVPKRADGFGGEAFSTKTLEFMALGVPILVSRTPIDQSYFNESNVAFFEPENEADFAAKALELADNRSRRAQLAQNGLAYIRQNNWGVREQVYLQLVSRLCAKGGGKRAAASPPPD